MKRLLKAFLIAIIGVLLIASPVLAISNPDSIAVDSQRIFENVFESGDMLFVMYYDVAYAATPTETASSAFFMNLYDTDGTTLLYSRGINYYQENIQAIYLDATAAAALTWGSSYVLKLTGNPAMFATITEGVNKITHTLAASDWIEGTLNGTTPTYMRTYLADVMLDIDTAGIDIMVAASGGNVLNTLGRLYFTTAIPGLDSVIPTLFQISVGDMDVTHDTPTGALATELSMTNKLGASVAAAFSGLGDYFGVSGNMMGGIFLMVLCMLVMFVVYKYSSNITASMVRAVPFLLLGTWSGLLPLAILYITIILIVAYMLYHFWLAGI